MQKIIFTVAIYAIIFLGIYLGSTFQNEDIKFGFWFVSGAICGSLTSVLVGWCKNDQKELAQ